MILGCTVRATNTNALISAEESAVLPEDIQYALLNDQSDARDAFEALSYYLGEYYPGDVWPEEYAGCYINSDNVLEENHFTLGVWVTQTNGLYTSTGILTCGHPFVEGGSSEGDLVAEMHRNVFVTGDDDSRFGFASWALTSVGGEYDYAYIPVTNSRFLPSTELKTGGHITNILQGDVCSGETTFILGQKSGLMLGRCSETTSWDGCPTISRGFVVDLDTTTFARMGDSGGIVYFLDGTTRYLAGFQSAVSGEAGVDGNGNSLYSVANVAEAGPAFTELGVEIYTG